MCERTREQKRVKGGSEKVQAVTWCLHYRPDAIYFAEREKGSGDGAL